MSGISTDVRHAILDTTRGMNIDTFRSATELAAQAIRSAMWEFKEGAEHVRWLEAQVPLLRDHYELPQPSPAPSRAEAWSSWDEAERISNEQAVEEAIGNLLKDQTGDNATCLVRAVLEAARGVTLPRLTKPEREALKNLHDHLNSLTAVCEDRNQPKAERHYQDGALDIQTRYAREWLRSIESEDVRKLFRTPGVTLLNDLGNTPAAQAQMDALCEQHDDAGVPCCPPGEPHDFSCPNGVRLLASDVPHCYCGAVTRRQPCDGTCGRIAGVPMGAVVIPVVRGRFGETLRQAEVGQACNCAMERVNCTGNCARPSDVKTVDGRQA